MGAPHGRGTASVKVESIVASEISHQIGALVVADATAIGYPGIDCAQHNIAAVLAVSAQRTSILGTRGINPTNGRGGDIITIENAHIAAADVAHIGAQASESGQRHSYFDFDGITVFEVVYEVVGISIAA